MPACPKCGADADDGAEKCFYCGTGLRRATVEPSGTSPILATTAAAAQASINTASPIRTHSGAVWAFVLGLLGPVLVLTTLAGAWFISGRFGLTFAATGILAIVVSAISIRRISASEGRLKGKGMAIWGLVLGALMVVVWLVGLIRYLRYMHGFGG